MLHEPTHMPAPAHACLAHALQHRLATPNLSSAEVLVSHMDNGIAWCRREFHEAMLALLCDCLATAVDSPTRAGALLPAVAYSGRFLQAHARNTLAAHRTSTDALQQLLRDDAILCKVCSNL